MEYRTKGTCSSLITFDIVNGKVHNVKFQGGCNVIEKLEGTTCGFRKTSCPDQLAKALRTALHE